MKLTQNQLEHLEDMILTGKMSADEANVEMVKYQRVRLIKNKIPRETRNALNAAVKSGELGHMKRDGQKPEAYFHPKFEHLARGERAEHERAVLRAAGKVLVGVSTDYD